MTFLVLFIMLGVAIFVIYHLSTRDQGEFQYSRRGNQEEFLEKNRVSAELSRSQDRAKSNSTARTVAVVGAVAMHQRIQQNQGLAEVNENLAAGGGGEAGGVDPGGGFDPSAGGFFF
tara:strand:- start:923 stop:1273 length:351 start_codon:yes stop_codon:yes gene_type:complete